MVILYRLFPSHRFTNDAAAHVVVFGRGFLVAFARAIAGSAVVASSNTVPVRPTVVVMLVCGWATWAFSCE